MLIIEDASGVQDANSYQSVADITAYLTSRNRQAENNWDTSTVVQQEAAAIAATDFIENRFSLLFKGVRKWRDIAEGRTVLTFTVNPNTTETVTIGASTYTFLTTPVASLDVEIGSTLANSVLNLVNAINDNNIDVNAFDFFGDSILVAALVAGTGGNGISTTTTVTGATFSFATTRGGNDTGESQPLSFPRVNLLSRDGVLIRGIPDRLKQSQSEYAVRALVSILQKDVLPDQSGLSITLRRRKVGPIETETEFQDSASIQLAVYPAADALLSEYLKPSGGAIR